VVTICATSSNLTEHYASPYSLLMRFMGISEQTAVISLYVIS